MKKISEASIQSECVRWFNNNYCLKTQENRGLIFSVPNESVVSQQKFVNLGLLRGVSDTIVLMKGICLFIEFKTQIGYQSEYQKEFQNRVELLGFKYYVVRSLVEFQSIIKQANEN
jgi:hypothetical protein